MADCWFPGCDRGSHHRGQHSGLREAGAKLVEIAKVGREIADLPDSDLGRRAELVELLLRLAVA
jgi:hypothetical protein